MLNCILIPYNRCSNILLTSLELLLAHCRDDTTILLIDDCAAESGDLPIHIINHPRVICLRNERNRGPASARNLGIQWCREHGIPLVVFLDSDCLPKNDIISEHIKHHCNNPDAVCIGGAIEGVGRGVWAELDKVASWFTSLPQSPPRVVNSIYHIPTTNMSVNLASIVDLENPFDEQLRTGEDAKFVRQLLKLQYRVLFFPTPVVQHYDRETFSSFVYHQYCWGLHTYRVRYEGPDHVLLRCLFVCLLIPAIPLFAGMATVITLIPWLKITPIRSLSYLLPLYILYIMKGFAIAHGIIDSNAAIRH